MIKALNKNNQDNILYKVLFNKLINIMQNNKFINIKNRDKLWSLVLRKMSFGWWKIRINILLRLCLNK